MVYVVAQIPSSFGYLISKRGGGRVPNRDNHDRVDDTMSATDKEARTEVLMSLLHTRCHSSDGCSA